MHEITVTGRKLTFSESTLRRNPGLFAVGAAQARKPEQNGRGKGQNSGMAQSEAGLGYRVTIISCRKRLLDGHDNLRGAAKALCDRITETLGFSDDADPRLQWEYGQCVSETEGTIVKIERL